MRHIGKKKEEDLLLFFYIHESPKYTHYIICTVYPNSTDVHLGNTACPIFICFIREEPRQFLNAEDRVGFRISPLCARQSENHVIGTIFSAPYLALAQKVLFKGYTVTVVEVHTEVRDGKGVDSSHR